VCALSDGVSGMLVGRALQGLAMGFIPVAISLVRELVPPKMSATAIAALSATMGVGAAIGLPLAAWVVQSFNWHTLFWGSAALAAVVLATTVLAVPRVRDTNPGRLDMVGAIGIAIGLVAVLVGVSKGNDWGWGDVSTLGMIIGGVVVLACWAAYELRHHDPIVDLRVTARGPVALTNLAATLIGFGMMAQSIVVPQLLEMPTASGYGLGQTLLEAGLWMAPGGLMMMAMAPVSSRLLNTIGGRTTLTIGASVLGCGYLVALMLMQAPWQMMVAMCVGSAGVGIGYAAMPTLILENVPMREASAGVAFNTLMRSIGTTVAGAVMATLLTSRTVELTPGTQIPSEGAFQLCFLVGAVAAFAGAAIALLIPRNRGVEPVVPNDVSRTPEVSGELLPSGR
ncbi:MAG: MFS transporter, partial [Nocardioidaceae bacterium]